MAGVGTRGDVENDDVDFLRTVSDRLDECLQILVREDPALLSLLEETDEEEGEVRDEEKRRFFHVDVRLHVLGRCARESVCFIDIQFGSSRRIEEVAIGFVGDGSINFFADIPTDKRDRQVWWSQISNLVTTYHCFCIGFTRARLLNDELLPTVNVRNVVDFPSPASLYLDQRRLGDFGRCARHRDAHATRCAKARVALILEYDKNRIDNMVPLTVFPQ